MITFIKNLFGSKSKTNFKQLHLDGAIILDVRSPGEYKSGHIKGAINVPLQSLKKEVAKIKKMNKPVITCCLSGTRSSIAKKILTQEGIEVFNGGSWQSLRSKIDHS